MRWRGLTNLDFTCVPQEDFEKIAAMSALFSLFVCLLNLCLILSEHGND